MEDFSTITHTDPLFEKAVDLFEQLSANEEVQAVARQRMKAMLDYNTIMSEAKDESARRGIEKIRERTKRYYKIREQAKQYNLRVAHVLKEQNIPLQSIADSLGLTLAEVEGL
jgi:predicted transposase YdaD